MKKIGFYMPVNYVKEYLMFLQTVIVFLPLKFFFKMAAIIPILRIDVYKWTHEDNILYMFYENLG